MEFKADMNQNTKLRTHYKSTVWVRLGVTSKVAVAPGILHTDGLLIFASHVLPSMPEY